MNKQVPICKARGSVVAIQQSFTSPIVGYRYLMLQVNTLSY